MTGGLRNIGRLIKNSYKSLVNILLPPLPPKKIVTGGKELDELVKYWWDEEGDLKHAHLLNYWLMPGIQEGLVSAGRLDKSRDIGKRCKAPFEGVRFLVPGCEGGIISEAIVKKGGQVVGIDACQNRIAVAKAHRKISGLKLTYFCSTMEQFAQDNSEIRFDVVLLPWVIERIEHKDKEAFLNSAIKLIKPKGSLFIVTVNKTAESLLYSDMHENLLRDCQIGTYSWDRFIRSNDLEKILEKNQIGVVTFKGLDLAPLDGFWRGINRVDVHIFLHGVKTS